MEHQTYGFEESFQSLIVATALQDPSFLRMYEDVLLPSYFDYDYLSSILRIARELTERLEEVPSKMTMVEEVKAYCQRFNIPNADREFTLNKLEDLYSIKTVDAVYIQDKVIEFGRQQSFRSAVLKIVTLFNKDGGASSAAFERARGILEAAVSTGIGSRDMGLSLYPALPDLPMMAADTASGLGKRIPTMISTLDRKTNGGPGRGEVWAVIGLPGTGKTAFLVNIGAAALKNGFPVIHFTIGDLNEVDIGVRYAARLTMCSTLEVISNTESYQRKSRILAKYNPHLHIKYYPSATATMGHLRAYISRLKAVEEITPALIIIDYPEELKRPFAENLYLSGEENYSQMNKMSADFDALVWTASQPKKWEASHDKDVLRGDDMGESRRKIQKLDGLVSWNCSYEEEMMGRARLWVDKCRRAKAFYLVHMDIDLERMLIKEGKPPEDTE